MVIRPPRETRNFHESTPIELQNFIKISKAQLSKIFHPFENSVLESSISKIATKVIEIKNMSSPLEHINLEKLNEPVRTISFNPASPVEEEKTKFKLFPKLGIALFYIALFSFGLLKVESYFKDHLLYSTYISGQSISFLNRDQALNKIKSKIDQYSVTVDINGNKTSPSFNDIGLEFDINASLNKVIQDQEDSNIISHLMLWHSHKYDIVYKFDKEKANQYFVSFSDPLLQPSTPANIEIKDGKVVINPETVRKISGIKEPDKSILKTLKSLQPIVLTRQIYVDKPKVTRVEIEKQLPKIQAIVSTKITLSINNKTYKPSMTQIAKWLNFEPIENNKLSVDVDYAKVSAYINQIAEQNLATPKSQILVGLLTSNVVLKAGQNGMDISDKNQTISLIVDALKSGKNATYQLPSSSSNYSTIVAEDIDKWLEVDLKAKRIIAYEFQNPVKIFPISSGSLNNPTVTGKYRVTNKVRQQDKIGLNSGSFITKNVEFNTYFYNDLAIEGSYWLPAGTLGVLDQSNGDIDLSLSDAAWIYNWTTVGTSIIIHT